MGGALFGGGPVVGKLGGDIAGAFQSSAAAGRFADISGEGSTFSQRIAMKATGSVTPAPPVGGGGLETAMGIGAKGQPVGISPGARPTGQGFQTTAPETTQPPISLHNFLQDIEGTTPTRFGQGKIETTPGEPTPSPPARSTPVPATQPPYSGTPGTPFKVDFTEPAPSPATVGGRPLFGGEYGIKPIDSVPPARGGPSGMGYRGGGGVGAEADVGTTSLKTPPGSTFDAADRFRSTFDTPGSKFDVFQNAKGATLPGLGTGQSQPSSFKTATGGAGPSGSVFTRGFIIQQALPQLGTNVGQGKGQGAGQGQGQPPGTTVTQIPTQIQIPVQPPPPPPPGTTQIQIPVPITITQPPRGDAGLSSYFMQPPSMPGGRGGKKQRYGFRQKDYGVGALFNLSSYVKGTGKRRKSKR